MYQCSVFQLPTLFAKSGIALYKAFEGGDAVASLTENNAVEDNSENKKCRQLVNETLADRHPITLQKAYYNLRKETNYENHNRDGI